MEINLDEISSFTGPLEEVDFLEDQKLVIHNLMYLGEMSQIEKVSYSLFIRNLLEAEKIYEEILGNRIDLEVEEVEQFLFEMEIYGDAEDELAIQKMQKFAETSKSWYLFLEKQIRTRFAVSPYRNILFLPGYLIFSFSENNEVDYYPYFFENKKNYIV
jgi:hypothetical protein